MACAATVVRAASRLAALPLASLPPPKGLRVTFLDVGQGDWILLQWPRARCSSTGPPEANVAQQLRRARCADAGRGRPHASPARPHRRRRGRAAADRSRTGARPAPDGRAPYERAAPAGQGSAVSRSSRHAPATRTGSAGCTCAFSGPTARHGERGSEPAPVVLLATYGEVDALLTGDSETAVTRALLSRPVEILKVAHHGSADDGLETSCACCGRRRGDLRGAEDNDYGHPRAVTWRRCERARASASTGPTRAAASSSNRTASG